MKKIFQWLVVAAALAFGSLTAQAGGSNPGLYYGQVPTAAQWNSYFAAKLDYTPGAASTIPYWDGSGNLLNALVSGDCTSANNVFTCTASHATSLAGGALGSIPYQSATGVTAFLAGTTSATPSFVTSTGTGAATLAPTLTSSTGSGSVVLATSPTLVTPALGTPSALVGTNITGTAAGLSIGGNAATATSIAGQTQWGVLYQSASGVTGSTAAGSAGQVLTSNGTSAPTFQPATPVYAFRNRLINSDMSVSQVNGGTAVTPTATAFVTDQWQAGLTQASKLTFQQVVDAPAGLKYSTKISVASQYSPIATDAFNLTQNIEGQNIIDFQMGTAGAVTIVTSLWIKGSVAGNYAVSIRNGAANRSYIGTVAVTTGWQRLSISLIGDTTGTWVTDNTSGFNLTFDLGSGSNFNTTAGAWQTGNFLRTASSVTFVNQVAGSTLNITGVQVEAVPAGATVPTAFEFLPYETQLRRAQRYLPCWNSTSTNSWISPAYTSATTSAVGIFNFPVPTRAVPTGITVSNVTHFNFSSAVAFTSSAATFNAGTSLTQGIVVFTITGGTASQGGSMSFNSASGQLCFTGAQL